MLEQKLTQARIQLNSEEQTLQTLNQYIADYSNINNASWPNHEPDSALHRLKNGSRFIANLQLALMQQQSKIAQFSNHYEKLLAEWQVKSESKQQLTDLIAERKLMGKREADHREDQLQNDDWVANR